MFRLHRGKTKFMWFPVTASTAFSEGDIVYWNVGSNALLEGADGINNSVMVGVIRHAIASTDDDYADTRNVEVEVPVEKWVEWSCDTVGTGTVAAADVGTYADIDGGGEIDVDNSTYDVFYITRVVTSSTTAGAAEVHGVLNIGPECLGTIGD